MTTNEEKLHDPARFYREPKDVLRDESLSVHQQLAVLKQWEVDAIELQVAEDENMAGDGPDMLHRVRAAIQAIEHKE